MTPFFVSESLFPSPETSRLPLRCTLAMLPLHPLLVRFPIPKSGDSEIQRSTPKGCPKESYYTVKNHVNYLSTGAGIKLLIQNKITICNNAMNYLSTGAGLLSINSVC